MLVRPAPDNTFTVVIDNKSHYFNNPDRKSLSFSHLMSAATVWQVMESYGIYRDGYTPPLKLPIISL